MTDGEAGVLISLKMPQRRRGYWIGAWMEEQLAIPQFLPLPTVAEGAATEASRLRSPNTRWIDRLSFSRRGSLG
jgi:hypothetical protein